MKQKINRVALFLTQVLAIPTVFKISRSFNLKRQKRTNIGNVRGVNVENHREKIAVLQLKSASRGDVDVLQIQRMAGSRLFTVAA